MRRPVNSPYRITTEFGTKDSNAFFGYHSGVDYAVAPNTPVYAPAAGQIVYAAFNATGGNMVILFDGQFYHRLMHNNAMHVSVNQRVSEGQHIASSGSTGLSTGPHVHWDIMDEIISSQTPRPTSFAHFKDPAKWLAGDYKVSTPVQGGTEVFQNLQEVKEAYIQMRGQEGTLSEMQPWVGLSKQRWIQLSTAETQSTRQQLADVKKALANLQNQPPKEVIKVVEKIVEKPVEVIKTVEVIKEVPAQVDEKAVVTNWFKNIWNSFFKK